MDNDKKHMTTGPSSTSVPVPPPSSPSTSISTSQVKRWGRMDAEDEDNLPLLDSTPDTGLRDHAMNSRKTPRGTSDHYRSQPHAAGTQDPEGANDCLIFTLPPELIDNFLSYLSPADLLSASQTCRQLHIRATSDFLWQALVQANVPGTRVTTPYPCKSFMELYAGHDPRWFLPKYKIWFSGQDLMGKLILVRYDQRRGCIEGYQLLAISNRTAYEHWQADEQVIIHTFEPTVKLHLDKPVVQLRCQEKPGSPQQQPKGSRLFSFLRRRKAPKDAGPSSTEAPESRFAAEIPMAGRASNNDGMFSNFMLSCPLPPDEAEAGASMGFPYGDIWPPPSIPAHHRVSAANFQRREGNTRPRRAGGEGDGDAAMYTVDDDRPYRRGDISDQSFRIRSWMEMRPPMRPGAGAAAAHLHGQVTQSWPAAAAAVAVTAPGPVAVAPHLSPHPAVGPPAPVADVAAVRMHIGEEVTTYATLDPVLYTPTADCPWRGIWVGDYSGHGCEFLLVNQVHDDEADEVYEAPVRAEGETDEDFARRQRDARIYRGRLEAIKLTGDPNVPRGEYTFVVDDLGPKGFVNVVEDAPFKGARVVKSKGHVARSGFTNDKFIESQLLLISPNRLAQYWLGFGHISFFERVDIDRLLKPT